ncbi:MAG TPA: hypothetical protein VGE69_08390 [Pseudomonadales bacterium]
MDKKFNLERRGLLPGFADGRYEAAPTYDPGEFARTQLEDPLRRDNRVNIKVSGQDMAELHRMALAEGLPLQSLLAQVVHQYASGQLQRIESAPAYPADDTDARPGLLDP